MIKVKKSENEGSTSFILTLKNINDEIEEHPTYLREYGGIKCLWIKL